MRRSLPVLASLALAALALPAAAQAPASPASPSAQPTPTPVPITIQSVEAAGVSVHFLNIPWGPQTFAAMERPGDSFYNKRSWPFARMESKVAVTLDGKKIPPGNYALVFHPNGPSNEGMGLEVRRIEVAEFLQAGNAMTRTPEGETIYRAPVRFDTTTSTAPALKIDLSPQKGALGLRVQYGDRVLTRDLQTP
jgi:hypothetical protein